MALAYTDGNAWVSEGWWNLKANTCETLLRGPLAAEFYYVYGIDESGGEWKGKAFMCTRDREFRIDGRQDCFVRGFDRTGFFEIDTGKDAKDWTVQLTEPASPGAPGPCATARAGRPPGTTTAGAGAPSRAAPSRPWHPPRRAGPMPPSRRPACATSAAKQRVRRIAERSRRHAASRPERFGIGGRA